MTATLRNLEGQDDATILREIQSALNGLKFGSVEITVHNGQVVQIERARKNSASSSLVARTPEPFRQPEHGQPAMNRYQYCRCNPRMPA